MDGNAPQGLLRDGLPVYESQKRFAAGIPVWRPRLLWLSTSLNSLCLRRPMRAQKTVRVGAIQKRRPYKKIRLGSLIDVRKVDKLQLTCATAHGEHTLRLPNAPLCTQITEILLELMRLQPRTMESPSPEGRAASARRSAGTAPQRSVSDMSVPGTAGPSTARAVKNLRKQLALERLSTPRRSLSLRRLGSTPRAGTPRAGATPRGSPHDAAPSARKELLLRSASVPPTSGAPKRFTSFFPEDVLYSELKKVRPSPRLASPTPRPSLEPPPRRVLSTLVSSGLLQAGTRPAPPPGPASRQVKAEAEALRSNAAKEQAELQLLAEQKAQLAEQLARLARREADAIPAAEERAGSLGADTSTPATGRRLDMTLASVAGSRRLSLGSISEQDADSPPPPAEDSRERATAAEGAVARATAAEARAQKAEAALAAECAATEARLAAQRAEHGERVAEMRHALADAIEARAHAEQARCSQAPPLTAASSITPLHCPPPFHPPPPSPLPPAPLAPPPRRHRA